MIAAVKTLAAAVTSVGRRYSIRAEGDGAWVMRDGKLFVVVASTEGAAELVEILERADRLVNRHGLVGSPAIFQRRKIASAIAMALDYQLETDSDRKARLERERDVLQTDRLGTYDAGPNRQRLSEIETELAALRAPLTFAAGCT